jgi:NAD(P)-dependent dehydrogenase (short-subunit alcohol dehydrogenase family)
MVVMATSELAGKTVLITGATDGLGRALAADLAGRGATLLLHGRDGERGRATLAEVAEATGSDRLYWYRADLASLAEVRELANAVGRDHTHLDVLVSNAGIGTDVPGGGARQESADGIELRFAVNYLAGFALTHLLWPQLAAAPSARVVSVSSAGQAPIDFDDVMLERSYNGTQAYCQSKLAQIMMTFDLADGRGGTPSVVATALHPSTYMPTKIVHSPISTVADGVLATSRLVWDLPPEQVDGRYFNVQRAARAHEQAHDACARARLRQLSAELAKTEHH